MHIGMHITEMRIQVYTSAKYTVCPVQFNATDNKNMFVLTGAQIGTVVAIIVSGILCEFLGWESAFYVFGEIYLSYVVN